MSETNGHTAAPASHGAGWLRTFAQTISRMSVASLFGGKRDLQTIFGYPPTLTYEHFKAVYERQDIAHRVVRFFPEKTWAQPPMVQALPQHDTPTDFETAWDGFVKRLRVFEVLQRADVLASLGYYSVILLGVRGQSQLATPLTRVRSMDDVVYLAVYGEEYATIASFDEDVESPTFGRPLSYRIRFGRGTTLPGARQHQPQAYQGNVHASRVLHIAEHLLDDEVYGLPRLYPVYDRLVDLQKVTGGSAEMYYRDAKRRIALELREGYTLSPEDEAVITAEAEEFQHGFRDFLRLVGVEAKNLSGVVASPRDHFDVLMDAIAAGSNIPKRQLLGSELGELASSQDERRVAEDVTGRQQKFAGPRILEALIDRLMQINALPTPAQGYEVVWPNVWALPETAQATIIKDYATSLAQAVTAGQFAVADGIARVMLGAMGYDPEKPPEPIAGSPPPPDPLAPEEEEL